MKLNFCELNIMMQGEELRKQIGASAYIECSSKTQQVDNIDNIERCSNFCRDFSAYLTPPW